MGTITKPVVWCSDEKKYGNYSFKLKDVDAFFRCPKHFPDIIKRGNTVKVTVEKNSDGDYQVKKKPVLVEAAKGKGGWKGGGKGGGGYKSDPERQAQIIWQHSQEMALRKIDLLIDAGGFGEYKTEKAAGARLDSLLDEFTVKFFKEVTERPQLKDAAEVADDLEESEEDLDDPNFDDAEPEKDDDDELEWDDD